MSIPLLLMSFLVGILIGLTSMGGAALMAPFLILILGVRPVTAVGTDLVYGAVTKIVGAWVHWKQGTVDLQVVRKLATGSIPGGLLGTLLVILLPRFTHDAQRYEQRAIGFLLVVVAIVLIVRLVMGPPKAAPSTATDAFPAKPGNRDLGGRCGLLRRFDLGGKRLAPRPLPADALSLQDGENCRHGHLPRRAAGVGYGHRSRRIGGR